jgi:protein-S-isoprenylcysteine O-methyltransferase Ste14
VVRRCCFPKSSSRRSGSPSSLLHGLMLQKTGAPFRWRHVLGSAVLILVLMALISHPLVPEGTLLHGVMDAVGFMFYLAGLGFRFWATLYVGGRKGSSVIAEGPYSVCRNPLYLGSFLLAIASALFIQSWVFAVGIVAASLFYIIATVPREERHMRDGHGEEYVQYCRRVPRFVPRFSLYHSPPEITVSIKGLWIECRRIFPWLWVPLLGELIAHARSQPWIPHYF